MLKYFRYFHLSITYAQIILGVLYLLSPTAVLADSTQSEQISENTSFALATKILKSITQEQSPFKELAQVEVETPQPPQDEAPSETINQEQHRDDQSLTLATKIGSITKEQSPSQNLAQVEEQTPQPPQDEPPSETINLEENRDQWHFKFQPYATIPVSTYGNVEIKGRTVDYSLGLGEVLEVLRVTASGRFEAWHNDLGFIIDAYYVSLSGGGIKESSRPRLETSFESDLTFDQGIYDFALSYHFGAPAMYSLPKQPSGKQFPQIWFEPIVGVRLNNITSSINSTLSFGRIDRDFQRTVNAGRTWFEPMIGGKIGLQVSDPVTLWVRGDISGLGIAGETDLSWNIIAGADWWVSRTISLQLGYRFYEINYKNGTGNNTFGFEQSLNGPYISATFNF